MQIQNSSITVGTTLTVLAEKVPENTRKLIVFTNTSALGEIITINIGEEPTALTGIVLYPTNSWSESIANNFYPSCERYYGIASAATATLAVHQRLGD